MSLKPGVRFGSYEIVELIGAGGMGDVYRARDPRLKRDVAIKVLPAGWGGDTDRTQRFQREAELLAALNHPNIAAIYDIAEADGVAGLLLELVEGPTLAELLAVRALPPRTALPIVRQIADALDAAHERGIVHRDLKPANIKVRDDGTVKVLDFGIGKILLGAAGERDGRTEVNDGNTRTGMILGTAAYMSPEQVRGQPVDRRTDIWAFGCVVYEILAGRPAFDGATGSDIAAAILDREPDWSLLPGGAAAPLERLIRHCLHKDRKLRLRDIGDVRIELDAAARLDDPLESSPRARFASSPWLVVAAGLALIAASAAATLGFGGLISDGAGPASSGGTSQMELVRATADEGVTADPALSEDGVLLAYASDRAGDNLDIWVQQTAGSVPLQLTDAPVDEHEPAFFPDGSRLVYRAENDEGGIYVVPTFGRQEPRLLVARGRRPRVSPDGRSVAYWTGGIVGLRDTAGAYRTFIIPASGGEPRELQGFTGARYPVWAPDGRSLLVLATRAARPQRETYDWWRVPIDATEPIPLRADELLSAAGIPFDTGEVRPDDWREDRVLFSDGNYVWSMRLDRATSVASNVERLTFGTNREFQAATAVSGVTAIASASVSNSVWALPIDAANGANIGPPRRLTSGVGLDRRASASRDGQLLAYYTSLPRPTILVKNIGTQDVIDLGVAGSDFGPAISPDGALVAYEEGGGVRVVPTRGGAPRTLCQPCLIGDWSPDSGAFVVVKDENNAGRLTWIDVEDGSTADLVVSADRALNRPFPSPDGRWLTFRSMGSTGSAVLLAPLSTDVSAPAETWNELVAPEPDTRPIGWSPDGGLVYFVSARDGSRCLYAQRIDPTAGTAVGEPIAVYHSHGGRTVYRAGANVFSTGPANAVGKDFVVYDLSDLSANIWLLRAR